METTFSELVLIHDLGDPLAAPLPVLKSSNQKTILITVYLERQPEFGRILNTSKYSTSAKVCAQRVSKCRVTTAILQASWFSAMSIGQEGTWGSCFPLRQECKQLMYWSKSQNSQKNTVRVCTFSYLGIRQGQTAAELIAPIMVTETLLG